MHVTATVPFHIWEWQLTDSSWQAIRCDTSGQKTSLGSIMGLVSLETLRGKRLPKGITSQQLVKASFTAAMILPWQTLQQQRRLPSAVSSQGLVLAGQDIWFSACLIPLKRAVISSVEAGGDINPIWRNNYIKTFFPETDHLMQGKKKKKNSIEKDKWQHQIQKDKCSVILS